MLIDRLHSSGKYQEYDCELMKLLEDGHAERVSLTKVDKSYYIPHRAV